MVTLLNKGKNNFINDVKQILKIDVKVERPIHKTYKIQFYNRQEYDHVQRQCKNTPRCLSALVHTARQPAKNFKIHRSPVWIVFHVDWKSTTREISQIDLFDIFQKKKIILAFH